MKRRPSARSAVPAGLLLLATLARAPAVAQEGSDIVRGPYLQVLLDRSVHVLWRGSEARRGRVVLRDESGAERTFEDAEPVVRHDIFVDGLSPATRYTYEIHDDRGTLRDDELLTFRTAPPLREGSIRAVVIGDSGDKFFNEQNGTQTAVRLLLESLEPDLFLHNGDLLYTGTYDEVVFGEYRRLLAQVGMFAARGDHGSPSLDVWFDMFVLPPIPPLVPCSRARVVCPDGEGDPEPVAREAVYYSFDWGPVHFSFIDSVTGLEPCSAQLLWLCRDLDDAVRRAIPWRVIVVHEHVYTVGLHSIQPSRTRELIPPIADAYGVHLVISGDDHNYQRSHPLHAHEPVNGWQDPDFSEPGGTIYVVTGGGGTRLYARRNGAPDESRIRVFHMEHHAVELEADRDRLAVRALLPDGTELDSFSLRRGAPRTPGFAVGDVAIDGDVNLADALELLNVLFLNGRPRCPPAFAHIADVNESDDVDLGDVVQLLNVLFLGSGGPDSPVGVCRAIAGIPARSCVAASCGL